MRLSLFDRLSDKFQVDENGCWLWSASINWNGYGQVGVYKDGGKWSPQGAHRAMYELLVEPVADGLELDHLCRVRHCVNPDHLEPVTRRENQLRGIGPEILRAINLSKTHCPQGHPYDAGNTGLARNSTHVARRCRACAREATARCRAKQRKAEAA